MRAKVISIKQEFDKKGHSLTHIFLDTMTEKGTYDTYTGPQFRNFQRWRSVIGAYNEGCELWLDGLLVKDQTKRLVSADSPFFFYREVYPQEIKSA